MLEPLALPSTFQSVKLPAALVASAKASAHSFRRSTAAQIEYWAILGKSLEAEGLTADMAQQRIQRAERQMALQAYGDQLQALDDTGALHGALTDVLAQDQAKEYARRG